MSTWRADSSAVSLGQPDVDSPYTFIPGKQQHFPCPPPPTQNQGCQTIYQIRKSVHTEHPTTSTSFHAKHEETLVTVSAFSSQEAKRADGCLRKAQFQKGPSTQKNTHPGPGGCSLRTVTLGRTCSIRRQAEKGTVNKRMSTVAILGRTRCLGATPCCT